jgi:hypothetical protein
MSTAMIRRDMDADKRRRSQVAAGRIFHITGCGAKRRESQA